MSVSDNGRLPEKIWYLDLKNFITYESYGVFFPSESMTFAEQLNSLMRLSLYFSIVCFIIKKDPNIFFVIVFMGLFTALLYSVDQNKNKLRQSFIEKDDLNINHNTRNVCVKPSKDNPFMNVLMNEYTERPNRPHACDQQEVQNDIKKAFDLGLYRDVGDIFHKVASDRQFITNPSTTIPNNREAFAKWCWGTDKTCKEGNGEMCYNLTYTPINS